MEKIKEKLTFNFKSLLSKMLTAFSVIILFILIIMSVVLFATGRSSDKTDEVIHEHVPTVLQVEDLVKNYMERNQLAYQYLVSENNSIRSSFNLSTSTARTMEEELSGSYSNPKLSEAIDLTREWEEEVTVNVLEENAAGNDLVAESNLNNLNNQAVEILDLYEEVLNDLETQVEINGQEVDTSQSLVTIVTIVLSILAIIISVVIAWLTTQSITNPIAKMKNRLEKFAEEDFSSEPLEVETEDEIGDLAVSLNTTQEYLLNLLENIKATSNNLATSSEEFEHMGREVQMGANQIAATMQELASGSEAQANSASNLASDMDSFSTTTKEALEYGQEVNAGAEEIVTTANEGQEFMALSNDQMRSINDIVQEAVNQMDTLNDQTSEISKLVDIINGIADQTNLLALNASIEAARAGEQGRGFAVVADEVRKLAEEVAASVTEITNYVEHVQEDAEKVSRSLESVDTAVEVGGVQITATEEKMEEIMEAINDMQGKNDEMTENLKNIATRSQEMNTMVDEIASVSEESAAGVEETSASVEEINSSMEEVNEQSSGLASIANDLNELIRDVEINEDFTNLVADEDESAAEEVEPSLESL